MERPAGSAAKRFWYMHRMTSFEKACATCGASTNASSDGHLALRAGRSEEIAAYVFCAPCWARHHRALALAVEHAVTAARDDESARGITPPAEPPQVTEDELNT